MRLVLLILLASTGVRGNSEEFYEDSREETDEARVPIDNVDAEASPEDLSTEKEAVENENNSGDVSSALAIIKPADPYKTIENPNLQCPASIKEKYDKMTKSEKSTTVQKLQGQKTSALFMKNFMDEYVNWDQFLYDLPVMVGEIGKLMLISSKRDFKLLKEGVQYRHILNANSFRATLVQIAHTEWKALHAAHHNMGTIRVNTLLIPNALQKAFQIIVKKPTRHSPKQLEMRLSEIEALVQENSKVCEDSITKITAVIDLINEVQIATVSAQSDHKSSLSQLEQDQRVLEARLNSSSQTLSAVNAELERQLTKVEKLQEEYDAAQKKASPELGEIAMAALIDITKSLPQVASDIVRLRTVGKYEAIANGAGQVTGGQQGQQEPNRKEWGERDTPTLAVETGNPIESDTDEGDDGDKQEQKDEDDDSNEENDIEDLEEANRVVNETEKLLNSKKINEKEAQKQVGSLMNRTEKIKNKKWKTSLTGALKKVGNVFKPRSGGKGKEDAIKGKEDAKKKVAKTRSTMSSETAAVLARQLGSGASNLLNKKLDKLGESSSDTYAKIMHARLAKLETSTKVLLAANEQQERLFNRKLEIMTEQGDLLKNLVVTDIAQVDFKALLEIMKRGIASLGRQIEHWQRFKEFFSIIEKLTQLASKKTIVFANLTRLGVKEEGLLSTYGNDEIYMDGLYEHGSMILDVTKALNDMTTTYTRVSSEHVMPKLSGITKLLALESEQEINAAFEKMRSEALLVSVDFQLALKQDYEKQKKSIDDRVTEIACYGRLVAEDVDVKVKDSEEDSSEIEAPDFD